MDLELDLSEFYCLNEDCPDYGKKGKRNKSQREIRTEKSGAIEMQYMHTLLQ